MIYFCGFNGFHQFGKAHRRRVLEPTELNLREVLDDERIDLDGDKIVITASWSYNIFGCGSILACTGFVTKQSANVRKTRFASRIKKICEGDNFCFVQLENGDLWQINVSTFVLEKLNLQIPKGDTDGCARKRNIFGTVKPDASANLDVIEHVSCGTHISAVVTKGNGLYNPSNKIFQFPKHVHIVKVDCGFEHAVALSSNGDVYVWGVGLRGQLGEDSMRDRKVPILVEALAGVKIVSVAAGGWHNVAVTAFGDVYCWGFNETGQLGIPVYKPDGVNKFPSVYPLPEVIDLPLCCKRATTQNGQNGTAKPKSEEMEIVGQTSQETEVNSETNTGEQLTSVESAVPEEKAAEEATIEENTEDQTEKLTANTNNNGTSDDITPKEVEETSTKIEDSVVSEVTEITDTKEDSTVKEIDETNEPPSSSTPIPENEIKQENVEPMEVCEEQNTPPPSTNVPCIEKTSPSEEAIEVAPTEIPDNCKAVKAYCGARHTIIQMECGQLFATGLNENGQTGVQQGGKFVDKFTKISVPVDDPKSLEVICGPWSTIFQN